MEGNVSAPFLLDLRAMFYLVTPSESSYQHLKDVPNFVDNALPYFTMLILLECVVLRLQGKDLPRINDGINSVTHGILSQLHGILFRSAELVTYVWIYNNYNIIDLPWDSSVTWILAFLSMDFLYYWFHRFSHESNVIWASHQVHHSSEDYNLTTALRQSAFQKYWSMWCYMPMALFLPPTAFYVHQQFNLLFQFWIHTETVRSIGPLEYILNTASHHRVHHGRNPYCIDKNYGGTLIIWDRIFNTFAAEDEKVIYGLVHPNQQWNPILGQFQNYLYILGLVKEHKTVGDKISAVVKGPGWGPGKPWTGCIEDIPEVEQPVKKYDSDLPMWANVYMVLHFVLLILVYSVVGQYKEALGATTCFGFVCFMIFSLTIFGALYDHRPWSSVAECCRCLLVVIMLYLQSPAALPSVILYTTYIIFSSSALLWAILTGLQYKFYVKTKKLD